MPYLYDLCQERYVCYSMIHDIFTFIHLMLFTNRIAYVFEINFRRPIRGALEGSEKANLSFDAKGLCYVVRARPYIM